MPKLLSLMMLALPAMVALRPAPDPQSTPLQRVAWLSGCWERRSGDRVINEQWMAPAGRMMLGMSRTVRGDSTIEYEHLEFVERDGKLAYIAHPSRQKSATFPQRELSDTSVVFEDLTHDFPQRVGYVRRGADSVVAYIEGTMNGNNRRINFPFARGKCGGQ